MTNEIEVLVVLDTEGNTKQSILVTDASNIGTERLVTKVKELIPPAVAFTRKKPTKELETAMDYAGRGLLGKYKEYEIFWETVELY
jgi:hypothetical protein